MASVFVACRQHMRCRLTWQRMFSQLAPARHHQVSGSRRSGSTSGGARASTRAMVMGSACACPLAWASSRAASSSRATCRHHDTSPL